MPKKIETELTRRKVRASLFPQFLRKKVFEQHQADFQNQVRDKLYAVTPTI